MRLSRWLVVAVLLLGACEDRECPVDTFVVNVVGTCPSTPTQVTLMTSSCNLQIDDSAGTSGLPRQGELDQAMDLPRQGNWQIYGLVCPAADPKCKTPTEFRRCFATRVQWRLELECLDGTGAPVCKAQLTE